MRNLAIICTISVLIFSCEKSINFPTGENMEVTSGFVLNTAIIISEGYCAGDLQTHTYICLESVLNDSRCPIGVLCIWEGNAQARFKFIKSDAVPLFFNLNTNTGFTNDTIVGGYKFTLKSLNPYPEINKIILPKSYKAEIEIEQVTI
jgi:hypothetical protein